MLPNHSITRLAIVPACTTWTVGRCEGASVEEESLTEKKQSEGYGTPKGERCGNKDCWIFVLCLAIFLFCAMAGCLVFFLVMIHDNVNEIVDGLGDGRFPSMDELGALTKLLVQTTASTATSIEQIASDTQVLIQESSATLRATLNTTQHTIESVDR
jgi:hypothetical protein